jgi:hypothetical protein
MEFITTDMFLTFAGCLTLVALIVEAIKKIPALSNVNAAWINLAVSTLVGIIRLFVVSDFSASGITMGILNILVIYLGAIGGYETVKQIAQKVKGE